MPSLDQVLVEELPKFFSLDAVVYNQIERKFYAVDQVPTFAKAVEQMESVIAGLMELEALSPLRVTPHRTVVLMDRSTALGDGA